MSELQQKRGQPDFFVLILTLILVGVGLVMIYSSSQIFAYMEYQNSAFFLRRQIIWALLGLVIMLIAMNFPYYLYKKFIPAILLILFILMVLVLTPLGEESKGAQRWLSLGFVEIQPSEFVKIGIILYLSSIFSRKQEYINQFSRGVLPPLLVVGLFFSLVLFQRDLGTGMILIFLTIIMIFCSGARFRHMFGLGLVTIVVFMFFATTQEYRMARLTSFMNPWADPTNTGYQLIQSFYAIANGGMFGNGFGNSIQKYLYLPERHTDFIFAIIAEELGFIGVLVIMLLYLLLILRGIYIANRAPDSFGALLAIGIISFIGIQVLVNLGVVSGVLPTTGLTLPFLSYGGSSLLLTMSSVGILLNISRYVRR